MGCRGKLYQQHSSAPMVLALFHLVSWMGVISLFRRVALVFSPTFIHVACMRFLTGSVDNRTEFVMSSCCIACICSVEENAGVCSRVLLTTGQNSIVAPTVFVIVHRLHRLFFGSRSMSFMIALTRRR